MTQMPTQTDTPAASLVGALREFALPDVLRLLAAGNHTGEVLVVAGGTDGRLWLRGGDLNGAAVRGTGGLPQAVFELSLLEDGWFYFTAGRVAPEPVPAMAVGDVLASVLPQVGEWRDLLRRVPLDATVHIAPSPPGANVQLTADQWQVLAAVGNNGMRVVDLVAATGRDQVETVRSLRDMVDKGLVVMTGGTAPPARPLGADPASPPPPAADSYPARARHASPTLGARPGPPPAGAAGALSGTTIVVGAPAAVPNGAPRTSAPPTSAAPNGAAPNGAPPTSAPPTSAAPNGATHNGATHNGATHNGAGSATSGTPASSTVPVAGPSVAPGSGTSTTALTGSASAGNLPADAPTRVRPVTWSSSAADGENPVAGAADVDGEPPTTSRAGGSGGAGPRSEDNLVPLAMARHAAGNAGSAGSGSAGRSIASDPPLPPMTAARADQPASGLAVDGTAPWPHRDSRSTAAEADAAGA